MTEAAFQEARKVMAKANYLRGIITSCKGDVAKWSNIEASHREHLREAQAEGAKKCLEKAIKRLDEVRQKFAALQFPDPDLKVEIVRCKECHRKAEECICDY